MSTRSYIGIIKKDGSVDYKYHHYDSYLDGYGIILSRLKTLEQVKVFLEKDRTEIDEEWEHCDTYKEFFANTWYDSMIEYCYAYAEFDNKWYVSSCHGEKTVYELEELLDNKDGMLEVFKQTYIESYQSSFLVNCKERKCSW